MEKGFKGLETGGSGARGLKQGSAKNCSEVRVEVVEMERIIRMEVVETGDGGGGADGDYGEGFIIE